MSRTKIIISGGGTGGHIFPAISIANALKKNDPKTDILFIGASNRMEMERVPQAGYPIVGLPVSGFDRKNLLRNIAVLWRLLKSLILAYKTIKKFKPDAVVGVGGYASGPTLKIASMMNIPTIIQEQNSYAGVTNKLLAKKASAICVAYEDMEKFFPKDKIIITGNPIRQDLVVPNIDKAEAYKYFDLDPSKKTLLIIGGSLGALTINKSIEKGLTRLSDSGIQVIWQTGKSYDPSRVVIPENVKQMHFISRMDYAYSVANLVVSRAGASSISELCILEKPSIFVPSPNVAEDHQTKNAEALSKRNAAVLVKDINAETSLVEEALRLINNEAKLRELQRSIAPLALHRSAEKIAAIVEEQSSKR